MSNKNGFSELKSASTRPTENGERYELTDPTTMPKAGGFLWNTKMMIQITCRGYATASFMQPEPAKYAYAPTLEAKTFMQPEQNYYAHHPGRFVYIKDEETRGLFSAPYEPVRAELDRFEFSVGKSDIKWTVEKLGVRVEMGFSLPMHDVAELWTIKVTNLTDKKRKLSVYPYFPIGYMSWMNQEAEWNEKVGGIVGSSVTPYQKAEDYPKMKYLKDKTYFLCETTPAAWEARQKRFEGEGGLHNPTSLHGEQLTKSDARYETPTAAVQYRVELNSNDSEEYRFLFGPAYDEAEILELREKYLSRSAFLQARKDYEAYILRGSGCLKIETPDKELDNMINNWLPRQLFYHGDVNRLTTDPQTRNYLQDNMGMSFLSPEVCRKAILMSIGQQERNGSMPDGILLAEGAVLKYINQIPHTDHCVWLPIALEIYLNETGDYALLDESVTSMYGDTYTVFERFSRAMDWLLSSNARDQRGLSYIAQGDWCDPMNMVGPKGVGVSGWLTVATAYAVNLWADICEQTGKTIIASNFRSGADAVNVSANEHLWNGDWYARGITDDGVTFGIKDDIEGRIWLNPQSWSILGGAASSDKIKKILPQVDEQLDTPYGVVMFAPPFTKMREDVGRVTQKYPGQGENGSVYNHAVAFYAWALYGIDEADRAYSTLRKMIPGPDEEDLLRRGQLPIFIPNYYRGGYGIKNLDRTAGRSSQLFNTGTISWVYRCFIEGLCGLKGVKEGLQIEPKMPSAWDEMKATRSFRGATFEVQIKRSNVGKVKVILDGQTIDGNIISNVEIGKVYKVEVNVPQAKH
ncbi:Six-hairpin glycosidase-like protein [Ampelomyces quisqualis]|uniref:Six-hairpin glycosidase-like protein n=1 Tax=Ampelomyces quisqualis TaxID=50730 RepID=A0A6A5R7K3_AMPQU|nr:Six-hairpin glycosidase-like protein [Ampelomyces quisqualis]